MYPDYSVKPHQWGPLSAVQSAIKHNADAMGLPHPNAVWPMWEGGGSIAHEYMTQDPSDFYQDGGQYPTWSQDGVEFNSNGESIQGPNGGTILDADGALVFGFTQTTEPSSFYYWASLDDDYQEFSFLGTNAATYSIELNTNGTATRWTTSFHRTASRGNFAVVWDTTVDGDKKLYLNGDSQTAYYADAATWDTAGVAAHNLYVGGRQTGNDRYAGGIIHYFYIFGDELTADQIALLHEQPYRLLYPVSRPFYSIPDEVPSTPGGGGSQLMIMSKLGPGGLLGACGLAGAIRNPSLTRRKLWNPLNWLR